MSKESPSLRLQPQLYKPADGFLRLDCTFPPRLSQRDVHNKRPPPEAAFAPPKRLQDLTTHQRSTAAVHFGRLFLWRNQNVQRQRLRP